MTDVTVVAVDPIFEGGALCYEQVEKSCGVLVSPEYC